MKHLFTICALLALSNAMGQTPEYVPTSGLVSWWNLNGDAIDEVGGNDGIQFGTSPTSNRQGQEGQALGFDGDDYVSLDTFFGGAQMTEASYSLWFNSTDNGGTQYVSGKEGFWRTIYVLLTSDGVIRFGGTSGGVYFGVSTEEDAFEFGTWNHLVVNFIDSQITLFLNGAEVISGPSTTSFLDYQFYAAGNSTATNYFGAIHPVSAGITNHFVGSLDEYGLWNRALDEEEVSALYLASTSFSGCTDPEACNYNADATSDDGSCIPSGCMNESACNFNQYAGCDDGSCAFDEDLLDCEAFGFEVDSLVVCLGEEIELVAPAGNGTTPLTEDGAVVDEFYLDFGGPSSHSLGDQPQGLYQITVSGTWCGGSCWNGHTSDAAYSFTQPYGDGISPLGGNSFTINEYCPQDNNSCELLRPEPDEYNAEHIYTYLYEHTGGELIFYGLADECCWWDNQAGLSFTVALLPDSPCVLDYSWTTGDANAFISIQPEASEFLGLTVSSSTEQCTDSLWIEVVVEGCSDAEACNFNPSDLCTLDCIYPVLGAEDCLQGAQSCGEGTTWNAVIQQCVSDDAPAPCGEGTYWDAVNEECAVLMPSDANFDGCVGMIDLLDLLSVYGTCNEAPWSCGEQLVYQGYDYETVQIGGQCWFAENLRAEQYSNGDPIPMILDDAEWQGSSEGARCWINNDSTFFGFPGFLYHGYAVTDNRGVCPEMWHVANDLEWMALEIAHGLSEFEAHESGIRGGDIQLSQKMRVESWGGTNELGFAAQKGGYRRWENGSFSGGIDSGAYWSNGDSLGGPGYREFHGPWEGVARGEIGISEGLSIRCIQDSE